MFPEIGWEEFETKSRIKRELISYGISENDIKYCSITGLIVDLKGKNNIPNNNKNINIALRTDIDCLEMHEQNNCSYKSKNDNRMHACGHDGHMAILLGFAYY